MNTVVNQFDVTGKTALVTGAASGIGLSMAEAMAECGAHVTLSDIDAEGAEREAARLQALGYSVRPAHYDITDLEKGEQIFADHVQAFGGLDICFANAGTGDGVGWKAGDGSRVAEGQVDTIDPDIWRHVIETNLNGAFYTVRNAVRAMKQGGKPGSIIVTTSNASEITVPMVCTAYMLAKSGAAHMVRNLARELAEFDIRINAIAPGSFITNIGGGHLHLPEVQEVWRNMIPLQRLGDCEKMKPLALYLASDASSFMTGSELFLDGGVNLVSSF